MDIRFVVTHLSHGSPGSFYRPYEMAKELTKQNVANKILTPFSTDVQKITDANMELLPNLTQKLLISNFVYGNIRKLIYNKTLSKMIQYDKFLVSAANALEKNLEKTLTSKPDVLQGEQEVAALASIKIGKKYGIKTVADIHNIWPEELVATGQLKRESSTFANLMKLEKFIAQNADGIIVVNDYMKEYLISNFDADAKKISIIPPGGEILFDENSDIDNSRTKKVIYAGLVNQREHVDLFVKSIPYVSKKYPDTKFVISEKGEDIKEIKNLCNSLSIKPDFYWYESRNEARSLLKTCHVGVLPSQNDVARKLGTPLKLLEYMSNGIPVVANDVSSWSDIIKQYDVGILTDDDPQDFAKAICTLLEDQQRYKTIRKNMANVLKEQLSWKHHVTKILIPLYNHLW